MSTTATTTPKAIEVQVQDFNAQDYLGKRFTSPLASVGPDVASAISGLYRRIQLMGSMPAGPPFLMSTPPMGGKMQIEVGAPCQPVPEPAPDQHRGRLAAGKAAVTMHRGAYEKIGPLYAALFAWAGSHGYRPAGSPREVYLNGPNDVNSSAQYLTQLVLPIA